MILECTISKDDLKIVLLKCVGSSYPTRIFCSDNKERLAYIRGFQDAGCNALLLSDKEHVSEYDTILVDSIIRVETSKVISYDRARSRIFNVN